MIVRLDNIKLTPGEGEDELRRIAERRLGARPAYFRILKMSLDARKKHDIHYVCSVEFSTDEAPRPAPLGRYRGEAKKIMIVGSGPAGLFCALRLADRGFAPVVIDRGTDVDTRSAAVARFFSGGRLDPDNNVQFGEGGAGTFSDGKLNTQTHSGYNADVLATFARFGAPEEVTYLGKPHIGSDRLKGVVRSMRAYILSCGGEVRFSTRLESLACSGGRVTATLYDINKNETYEEYADALVIAPGHSARDTFAALRRCGMAMEAREFAVGVRIEHRQGAIDMAQYGRARGLLPPADYKLVSHAGARTAFTFCMCPGGVVVPAASEEGGVVTNGMSDYARAGENADSALLVQMRLSDFGSDDLFAGMEFQRRLERAAFAAAGGDYRAPAQRWEDFARGRAGSGFGSVTPSYARGVVPINLADILPAVAAETLKVAVPDMARRLRGFDDPDAVMTGPETRFSSPVRLLRSESGESVTHPGVYPYGEGSGYSGGITSSAADGLRTADRIYAKFS